MHRHFDVPAFHLNPTVSGSVVEPFDVVGAVTVEFSVFTHVIVCAAAEESRMTTITMSPSVALVVDKVIVIVAAEELVKLLILFERVTVPALEVTVMVAGVVRICANVWMPVKVCAASVRAIVALVEGKVIVVASVPASVSVLFTAAVFPFAIVSVPVEVDTVSPFRLVVVIAGIFAAMLAIVTFSVVLELTFTIGKTSVEAGVV